MCRARSCPFFSGLPWQPPQGPVTDPGADAQAGTQIAQVAQLAAGWGPGRLPNPDLTVLRSRQGRCERQGESGSPGEPGQRGLPPSPATREPCNLRLLPAASSTLFLKQGKWCPRVRRALGNRPGKSLLAGSAAPAKGFPRDSACPSGRWAQGPRVSLRHPQTWRANTRLVADQGLGSGARQRSVPLLFAEKERERERRVTYLHRCAGTSETTICQDQMQGLPFSGPSSHPAGKGVHAEWWRPLRGSELSLSPPGEGGQEHLEMGPRGAAREPSQTEDGSTALLRTTRPSMTVIRCCTRPPPRTQAGPGSLQGCACKPTASNTLLTAHPRHLFCLCSPTSRGR